VGRSRLRAALLLVGVQLALGAQAVLYGQVGPAPRPPGELALPGEPVPLQIPAPSAAVPRAQEPIPIPDAPAGPPMRAQSLPQTFDSGPRLPAFRVLAPFQTPTAGSQPGVLAPAKIIDHVPPLPIRGVPTPVVSIEKTGPATARAGQSVAYEIVVRNVGTIPAAHVMVEDELPQGARLLTSAPPAQVHGQHLIWILDALAPGKETRCNLAMEASGSGDVSGTATVSVSASSTTHTQVQGPPLSASMIVNQEGPIRQGEPVKLQIKVVNHESQRLPQVGILVRLPKGLQHEAGAAIKSSLKDLEGGTTRTIDLRATAAQTGSWTVETDLTEEGGRHAHAQCGLVIEGPSLVVKMKGAQRLAQGDETEYRLEVDNQGDSELTNVVLTDKLPTGLELVMPSKDGVYNAQSRAVQWRWPALPPHQTRVVGLKVMARECGKLGLEVLASADSGQEAHLSPTVEVEQRPAMFPSVHAEPKR
jgi:uncharacterized repeat protein (TIGR01451 family)